MLLMTIKIFAAAGLIALSSWVARSNPKIGGFILALPLTTMIALAFNYAEFRDSQATVEFAKSTFYAIPFSLLFFVPFLFARKFNLKFEQVYGLGFIALAIGFPVFQWITQRFAKSF